MPNSSVAVKNLPLTTKPRQALATGFVIIAGLLIFLLVSVIGPKSASLLDASQEFETHTVLPTTLTQDLPQGFSATTSIKLRPFNGPLNLDLTRGFILSDQAKKLPEAFAIPDKIKKETALWFDLFSKYTNDTWLIVAAAPQPYVVEEWPLQNIKNQVGHNPSGKEIVSVLRERLVELKKVNGPLLRIQRGLRDDFLQTYERQQRWIPTIEAIFKAQKLSPIYARIFLIPKDQNFDETAEPWMSLNPLLIRQYLVEEKALNETHAPLKVARVIATAFAKKGLRSNLWPVVFEGSADLEARFYAAVYAEAYWDDLQLGKRNIHPTPDFKAIKLERNSSIESILTSLNLSMGKLRDYNPDILSKDKSTLVPKNYVFFVAH